jgi:hypothetical protein
LQMQVRELADTLSESVAFMIGNSDEGGTWYYVVDCAACKEVGEPGRAFER